MDLYDEARRLIDYSISDKNRKCVISSAEIGIGLFFIVLGIGTAMCEIESMDIT